MTDQSAGLGEESSRLPIQGEKDGARPSPRIPLTIVPISLGGANALVGWKHRHNSPLKSFLKYAVAVRRDDTGAIVGAAIIGGPSTKKYEDGYTVEVRRAVCDETPNANSALYGACARVAKELGYRRIMTFTLASESGVSLRASGWTDDGLGAPAETPEQAAKNPHKMAALARGEVVPLEQKRRWIKVLGYNSPR